MSSTGGELRLFATMPVEIRAKIWKFFIPNGCVVDVVSDKDQNQYFSLFAQMPTVLHICKESRHVGLKAYTLCFGTSCHPASDPFDFSKDCGLLDGWLALAKLPFSVECTQELQQLRGPMGPLERDGIHRIAFNSDFYTFFDHQSFTNGLKFLYQTFPELDFLVLVCEPDLSLDPFERLRSFGKSNLRHLR
jgi:hypothetical protein